MPRIILIFCVLVCWLSPSRAMAETAKTIAVGRVHFGDLVPDAPLEIAGLDLGPAPPAGSSRLYSREELTAVAQRAGNFLVVRESIRAVRATTRWSQAELLALVTPKLTAALPEYAKLLRVDVPKTLVTAANLELTRLELGQIPARRGNAQTSAVAELGIDGKVELRLTLPVVLVLDDPPKPIEVERGSTVALVINLGAARVSAAAVTLQTTSVGAVSLFRVIKTRKTLRARLLSTSTAEVVSE
jgi:hypothetical protein